MSQENIASASFTPDDGKALTAELLREKKEKINPLCVLASTASYTVFAGPIYGYVLCIFVSAVGDVRSRTRFKRLHNKGKPRTSSNSKKGEPCSRDENASHDDVLINDEISKLSHYFLREVDISNVYPMTGAVEINIVREVDS